MAVEQGMPMDEWFSKFANSPMVQHMQAAVEAQGRVVKDVSELSIHNFVCEGKPDGEWMTHDSTPVQFYELSFADRSRINQFWHRGHGPLTFKQAKTLLDVEKLIPEDRKFIEEYKPS